MEKIEKSDLLAFIKNTKPVILSEWLDKPIIQELKEKLKNISDMPTLLQMLEEMVDATRERYIQIRIAEVIKSLTLDDPWFVDVIKGRIVVKLEYVLDWVKDRAQELSSEL